MLGWDKLLKFNKLIVVFVLLAIYPTMLLGYVWYHCLNAELGGGENGPLDAYRHTLASAVLAYTLAPEAVPLVTAVMERKRRPADLMDRHNNAIGAVIGAHAGEFAEIEPRVLRQVKGGAINAAAATQTTWLPREKWRQSFFW